jgi:hypothetical protein
MTQREPRKIARLYAILDSLNVHRHNAFKTIVFSDTVLVYNPQLADSDDKCSYLVWYLIEFAEDLHHRLTGQDIYFRAVLTSGSFSHYPLQHIECFFGEALVNAYLQEKAIPAVGLFIDKGCNRYNKYFRVAEFDDQYDFVYLNRSLESLHEVTGDKYPFIDPGISLGDQAPHTPWQVRFLRDVYSNMRGHKVPSVRAKFLTTWDFYSNRYPGMTHALVQREFSLEALGGERQWITERMEMEKSIKHFKRIGSGTALSDELSSPKRQRRRKHA